MYGVVIRANILVIHEPTFEIRSKYCYISEHQYKIKICNIFDEGVVCLI